MCSGAGMTVTWLSTDAWSIGLLKVMRTPPPGEVPPLTGSVETMRGTPTVVKAQRFSAVMAAVAPRAVVPGFTTASKVVSRIKACAGRKISLRSSGQRKLPPTGLPPTGVSEKLASAEAWSTGWLNSTVMSGSGATNLLLPAGSTAATSGERVVNENG